MLLLIELRKVTLSLFFSMITSVKRQMHENISGFQFVEKRYQRYHRNNLFHSSVFQRRYYNVFHFYYLTVIILLFIVLVIFSILVIKYRVIFYVVPKNSYVIPRTFIRYRALIRYLRVWVGIHVT